MLSPDKKVAVETPHRIPRFGALLGLPVGLAQRLRSGLVATVFPEFIARDVRSARTGAVKEKSARVVRPAAVRGEDTAWRALTAHGSGLQSRTR